MATNFGTYKKINFKLTNRKRISDNRPACLSPSFGGSDCNFLLLNKLTVRNHFKILMLVPITFSEEIYFKNVMKSFI